MSDTHPQAFRLEAEEKRKEAELLLNQADDLEAQAKALEAPSEPQAPVAPPTVGEPRTDAPKGKLFAKK
jgi:hypothetical protein